MRCGRRHERRRHPRIRPPAARRHLLPAPLRFGAQPSFAPPGLESPTVSSCRLLPKQGATPRRRSCQRGLFTPADLAALTERVRRRVIRWFRMQRLLDAAAAADMLAWENSGFSVDAFRPDHALTAPSACLVSASRTPAAVLRPAAIRPGTALRDPRRRRPHPLRAPATKSGQLGRPRPRAQVHAARRERLGRTLAV